MRGGSSPPINTLAQRLLLETWLEQDAKLAEINTLETALAGLLARHQLRVDSDEDIKGEEWTALAEIVTRTSEMLDKMRDELIRSYHAGAASSATGAAPADEGGGHPS